MRKTMKTLGNTVGLRTMQFNYSDVREKKCGFYLFYFPSLGNTRVWNLSVVSGFNSRVKSIFENQSITFCYTHSTTKHEHLISNRFSFPNQTQAVLYRRWLSPQLTLIFRSDPAESLQVLRTEKSRVWKQTSCLLSAVLHSPCGRQPQAGPFCALQAHRKCKQT
jgi:hypothetical protein